MSDDTARDVHGDYMKWFNAGLSKAKIRTRLRSRWRSSLSDADEGPIVVLATAKAMWDCGHMDRSQLSAVRKVVDRGLGLDRWRERGPKAVETRKSRLRAFVDALSTPNPRPKTPKPTKRRSPIFVPGDCLAIQLASGKFAAAIVLRPNESGNDEDSEMNVIGQLRFLSKSRPNARVFEARDWLILTHGRWLEHSLDGKGTVHTVAVVRLGFRAVAGQFEVVGRTELRRSDPNDARGLWSWKFADQVELQMAWEKRSRRRGHTTKPVVADDAQSLPRGMFDPPKRGPVRSDTRSH